jgi:hypothetical protein
MAKGAEQYIHITAAHGVIWSGADKLVPLMAVAWPHFTPISCIQLRINLETSMSTLKTSNLAFTP